MSTAIDVTLIAVRTSTKNKDKVRAPEMHSGKKGNQWYFDMKTHTGVDANSGTLHSVRGKPGHISDIAEGNSLLRGQERCSFRDADCQGIESRPQTLPSKNVSLTEWNNSDKEKGVAKKESTQASPWIPSPIVDFWLHQFRSFCYRI